MLLGACDLQSYLTLKELQSSLCTFRAAAVTFDFFLRRLLTRLIEPTTPRVTLRGLLNQLIRRAKTIQQEHIRVARMRSSRAAHVLEVLLATADLQEHLNLHDVRTTLCTCRRTALTLLFVLRWLIPRLVWRALIRRRVELAAAIWDVSDTETIGYVDDSSATSTEMSHDLTPTFLSASEDSSTLDFFPQV